MLFLLINPPFQIPDEPNHFYRAYQISDGRCTAIKKLPPTRDPTTVSELNRAGEKIRTLIGKGEVEAALGLFYSLDMGGIGGFLPESLATTSGLFLRLIHPENKQRMTDIFPILKLSLDRKKTVFLHFPNTSVYSPVPYLPQALGIAVGKAFDWSPLVLMYLGRACNLFVWILLVYFSIKITPVCKWLFTLLALMPMSLYEAASLAADGVTNGLAFLLIALLIRSALDNRFQTPNIYALFGISATLALSKQAYFLLPLLFLMIPVKKIGSRVKFISVFFALIAVNIMVVIAWTLKADIYKDIYDIYGFLVPTFSAEKQTAFVLSNPLQYCRTITSSFIQNGRYYLDTFIGLDLNEFLRISYIGFLFAAVSSEKIEISAKNRFIIFSALFSGIAIFVTMAYIGWTPVGEKTVWGIQGRYFIPLSPLFFLLFCRRRCLFVIKEKKAALTVIIFSLLMLSYSLNASYQRYYF